VPLYLLDTDTISQLMAGANRKRSKDIRAWLQTLGNEPVVLSSVSISEINRGIALLEARNPVTAAALRQALNGILSIYEDAIITPSHAEWQIYAKLSAVPELRHLCHGKNEKNQARTGADAFLAVQANTISAGIASLNARDFVMIDRHMPIVGGIIDPASGTWITEPRSAD
jgi:predicted nucleic acid-binding protein